MTYTQIDLADRPTFEQIALQWPDETLTHEGYEYGTVAEAEDIEVLTRARDVLARLDFVGPFGLLVQGLTELLAYNADEGVCPCGPDEVEDDGDAIGRMMGRNE